ncbi:qor [Mucuna pruriens]|uniref:Qor n=1 Tax=Mucuna pruriens TaxID=157652 RepID=A0A371I8N1_MUCPR|nr:qor [Mucuna pruriens]
MLFLMCVIHNKPLYLNGMEAVGVVTAVGAGVHGRQVGDLVAYEGPPMGSYVEELILPTNKVAPVPLSIDPAIAASIILKGTPFASALFPETRVHTALQVRAGYTILVNAASSGVGSLLCPLANSLGVTVIGSVSNKEKESLECLRRSGCMVSYGQPSGFPCPLSLSSMGVLKAQVNHTYPLFAAAKAHHDLDTSSGVGSLLCLWANSLGVTVIGTVSNKEKVVQAKEDGYHHLY